MRGTNASLPVYHARVHLSATTLAPRKSLRAEHTVGCPRALVLPSPLQRSSSRWGTRTGHGRPEETIPAEHQLFGEGAASFAFCGRQPRLRGDEDDEVVGPNAAAERPPPQPSTEPL